MTKPVELTKNNGIATVTINRPEKHNAFDDRVIAQMTQAFEDINLDESIRVMVLASNGNSFSAGADLDWMKRKIQGAAFGGAVGLVSCCDIAIASTKASFSLSEVKIGLIPATISPYVIAAIGSRAARRLFISAERFSAQTAQSINLVSEICEHEQIDTRVIELTETICMNSPAAVSAAKQLVHDVGNAKINDALIEDTSKRIAAIRASSEGQEGLAAFLEKRAPSWVKPTE